jgi:hypothetical protein
MDEASSILGIVHNEEPASLKGRVTVCGSPLCDVRFEAGGPKVRPKRYCSPECRQRASILDRAAKLLGVSSGDELVRVLFAARKTTLLLDGESLLK